MDDVIAKVSELLRRNRVIRPPVRVERIAESLGLQVRFAPLDADVSGAILRSGTGVVIGVNSSDHSNRQRFTIAHEIGHFIYHTGVRVHIDRDFRLNLRDEQSSKAANWEEIEANRFAAELLMPQGFLTKDVESIGAIDEEVIEGLARRYKVSAQAMQFRLANLGFIDPL
jgi:Zn-dependent peptidase ImmA (M78 family)